MTASHTNVFYTDASNGWAVTVLDKNGFQIEEADYLYRKADAVNCAISYKLPAKIFGRNGLFQRTIKATI